MPRNWTLEQSQAEGTYLLSFHVHRGAWRHAYGVGAFQVTTTAQIAGSLEQFEQLARDLLLDCAAIRAEEGKP